MEKIKELNSEEVLEQLKEYVKFNGVKYRWVAAKIGISESYLCHWRHHDKNVSPETLLKIYNLIK